MSFEENQQRMRDLLDEINESGVMQVERRRDGEQGIVITLDGKGTAALCSVLTAYNNELQMRKGLYSEEEIISKMVYFWETTFGLLPPWEQEALVSPERMRDMFALVGSALAVESSLAMVSDQVHRDELLDGLGEGWHDDIEDGRV